MSHRLPLERLEERALLAVVSHWTADNTAADAVGTNHGTLVSGAAYAAGQINQAFSFDGVDDSVQVADSPSLKLTGSLSIDGWVNATSATAQHGMILFRGDDRSGRDPYWLSLEPSGEILFQVESLTATAGLRAPLPLGQFIHVAGTLDDATGDMRLYVNGVLMSQRTTAVRPFGDLDPASNPGFGIGNHGGAPGTFHNFPFHGLIDELRVHDSALTAEEVLSIFNTGNGGVLPTLSISDAVAIEGDDSGHYRGPFVDDLSGGHFNPITFGPDGNLYTAVGTGTGYNTIRRYHGTTGEFLDTFVPQGTIDGIRDIVFRDGYMYVASAYTDEVLRYSAGTGAFVDVFVTANSGGIDHPDGMAFGPDANGDGISELYVTGWLSHSVVRYDGVTGQPLGTYIASGSGGLSFPFALAFGPGGVYVTSADTNQILKYNEQTGAFLGIAASANLDYPRDVTFGADGLMYVTSGDNDRIIRFTADGAYVDDYVPAGAGGMDNPRSMVFGVDGDLYVTATGNRQILRFGTELEAVFTVTLSAPFPNPVSVDFATVNATAVAGSDYVHTSGTLTFTPGKLTKTLRVPTLDDPLAESRESFTVELSNVVGGAILDGSGTGTILDDDTTKFYVVDDGSSDRTYEYADPGSSIENYALASGNTAPRGAASNAAGDTVWVADANKKVHVYNTSGVLVGSWTAGSLTKGAQVEGIATDGTDVWIVDDKTNKVFKYAGAAGRTSGSQNAASSFKLARDNADPKGIVTDGTHLWVVNDSSSDKVFKYTLAGTLVASWTVSTPGAGSPTGITLDPSAPSSLWIVDSGTDRVYEYANALNIANGGSKSADRSFALAAGNTNPQGIADPPPVAASPAAPTEADAPASKPVTPVSRTGRTQGVPSDVRTAQGGSGAGNRWLANRAVGDDLESNAQGQAAQRRTDPARVAMREPAGEAAVHQTLPVGTASTRRLELAALDDYFRRQEESEELDERWELAIGHARI